MKKLSSLLLTLSLALALTACGGNSDTTSGDTADDTTTETAAEPVELYVFAAASMQESLHQVIETYKAVAPEVTVVATYDSSGTARVTLFSSRSRRVALSTRSRPSVFSSPPSASS